MGFPGVGLLDAPPPLFSAEFSRRNFSSSLENAALKMTLGNDASPSRPLRGQEVEYYFRKPTSGPPPWDPRHPRHPTVKKDWGGGTQPWPGPCARLSTVLTLKTRSYPEAPMSAASFLAALGQTETR